MEAEAPDRPPGGVISWAVAGGLWEKASRAQLSAGPAQSRPSAQVSASHHCPPPSHLLHLLAYSLLFLPSCPYLRAPSSLALALSSCHVLLNGQTVHLIHMCVPDSWKLLEPSCHAADSAITRAPGKQEVAPVTHTQCPTMTQPLCLLLVSPVHLCGGGVE